MSTNKEANSCLISGIDHVEFYVGNALQAAAYYCHTFKFQQFCYSGMETGNHKHTTRVVKQGNIIFSLVSSIDTEDEHFFQTLRRHGDNHVRDIAFQVTDVERVYQNAIKHGAISIAEPKKIFINDNDFIEMATIKPPYGTWVHTLIDRSHSSEKFLPNFKYFEEKKSEILLEFIDHIAFAIDKGELHNVCNWYRNALGFERFLSNDDDDQEVGITVGSENSGLHTIVISIPNNYSFKFVLIEPVNGKERSQIQEFLDFHKGPGVPHLALHTNNIIEAVSTFKLSQANFIDVPITYYEMWKEKEGYDSVEEDWDDLQKHKILIDGNAQKSSKLLSPNSFNYLLQTFTLPLQDRPTFYLEIISRKGANGFGKGNITQLFMAIERLQRERGTLSLD